MHSETMAAPLPVAEPVLSGRDWLVTAEEYLTWGKSFGGKKGRPMDPDHLKQLRTQLTKHWTEFATIEDVDATVIEAHLARMIEDKYAGATRARRFEAIHSFLEWCVRRRKYLTDNPVNAVIKPNADPESEYRALTLEEFSRLLNVSPPDRRLLYEVAADTGLRSGELRALTVGHLNASESYLRIRPDNDKTRTKNVALLTPGVCAQLAERVKGKNPGDKLLKMTAKPVREFDKDLKAAGIPKKTPDGKLAFHAIRCSGITWLRESGATKGQSQAFGRHLTSKMNDHYEKVSDTGLRNAKQRVATRLQELSSAVTSMPESPSSSPAQDVRFSASSEQQNSTLNSISEVLAVGSAYLAAPKDRRAHIRFLLGIRG